MPKTFIAKGAGGAQRFFSFGIPPLGLLPIPGVFLVKYGEMPYYVLEIL
jgi:hypothetical protein